MIIQIIMDVEIYVPEMLYLAENLGFNQATAC